MLSCPDPAGTGSRSGHRRARMGLAAVFAAAAGASVIALGASPSVGAAADPCAASEVAKTMGAVATDTGEYLETHPQTNQSLTMISQQQGGAQSLVALKSYFDSNPMVAADLQRLQQPLQALAGRCKLPVTLPQLAGLLQAAQQAQGATAALPGAAPQPATPAQPGTSAPSGAPAQAVSGPRVTPAAG
jgi:heme-binding protein